MRDLTHHHWGMSARNGGERNGGSRNDAALNAFTALLDDVSVSSAFVQTCGHRNSHYAPSIDEVKLGACPLDLPDCRRATALFMPSVGELNRDTANAMSRLSRKLRVPAFVVTHQKLDQDLIHPVEIARAQRGVTRSEGSWRDFTEMLRAEQFSHEQSSEHPDCTSADIDWLRTGVGKGIGVDLSLSNAIREVPGVRHTDIDAILTCIDCGDPIALIESSSDGITPREDAIKSATVARDVGRRARVVTLLIQHQVGDADLAHGISLTKWAITGSLSEEHDHIMTTWGGALESVRGVIEDHQERYCE